MKAWTTETPLDYQSQASRPASRRLGFYRRVALGTILLGFVVTLCQWPWLILGFRSRTQFVEWRCRSFSCASTRVAYDENHDSATLLIDRYGSEYQNMSDSCRVGPFAIYHPKPLWDLCYLGFFKDGIAFMHDRQARGSATRFVIVLCSDFRCGQPPRPYEEKRCRTVEAQVMVPGDPSNGRYNGPVHRTTSYLSLPERHPTLRVFFGQPDPTDASHFTIKYEIDDHPGTIDGWLQADDTVKLQIRDGPALAAATQPAAPAAGGVR